MEYHVFSRGAKGQETGMAKHNSMVLTRKATELAVPFRITNQQLLDMGDYVELRTTAEFHNGTDAIA